MLSAMFALLCAFGTVAAAQDQPPPKVELFAGYSFWIPGEPIYGQLPGALSPLSSRVEGNPRGMGASATYDFNRWFGLTLDGSIDLNSGETGLADRIDDAAFANISVGPKLTYRTKHFAPFFEVLVGGHRYSSDAFRDHSKIGFMIGGGLDIKLSRHFALRLIQADYVYSNYRFAPPTVPDTEIRGLRAQTGLILLLGGGAPPVPPSAACSVQPAEVFAGEPVTATASGSNFDPKRTVRYNWSGTGVSVSGNNATTQVDTTGLQPGPYTVTANLSEGGKDRTASCSARFRVREPRPPVISCTADPARVRAAGTSTITSNASSPGGRRLTYSYSASAGEISGNGETTTLYTRTAQPGRITVNCNVSDDHTPPLTASSTTSVYVEAPPPPPPPAPDIKQLEARLDLHSIYFQTARPYANDPEAGLLESQKEILRSLAEDFKTYLSYKPDAHLILGGYADPRGTEDYNIGLTQRRVDRTKSVLVEHGVPADHIDTQSFGKEDQLTADQIKDLIAQDPDLTQADRQQMLDNLHVMVLANNRRVDVSLASGQQSTRRYPFNAKDFLALISTKGGKEPPKP